MTNKMFDYIQRLTTRVKAGDVPALSSREGGICVFVLNVLIPGSGTFLASCLVKKEESEPNVLVLDVGIAILQFALAFILIGWLWSLWWGFLMYQASDADADRSEEEGLKQQARK